jgi:hypothetical protein
MKALFAAGGCFTIIALVALAVLVGPLCFAYDLNHIVPVFTGKPLNVSPFYWPVFLGGIFLSETAVPVAVIVFILVALGVLP